MVRHPLKKISLSGMVLLALAGCDNGKSAQGIAWVDIASVAGSPALIQQEQGRNDEVKKLLLGIEQQAKTRYGSMDKAAMQRAVQADSAVLNDEWRLQQAKSRKAVIEAVVAAVETYRQAHNLSIVLDKTQTVAASPALNITDAITTSLKDKKIDFGGLPDIKIKPQPEKTDKAKTP